MKKLLIVLSGIYIIIVGIIAAAPGFSYLNLRSHKGDLSGVIGGIFIFFICGLWIVLTGIGIIRKKNWARYSLFVMSYFAIFTGLILYVVAFFIRISSHGNNQNPALTSLILFAISTVFFIGIPLSFLIFFTRKSVKELFISKEEELKKSPRPFGIKLIVTLMFIGGIGSIVYAFFPPYQKLPLFGAVLLSGVPMRIYLLVFSVIAICIALGLFKLRKTGWIAYVVYGIFSMLLGLINTFTISEAALLEMMPKLRESPYQMPMIFYKISGIAGLLVSLLLLIYVISKKKLFFKMENAQNAPK